ncbi:hypothetical protein CTI14_55840, partial [Methylobacterium radiotolerans]
MERTLEVLPGADELLVQLLAVAQPGEDDLDRCATDPIRTGAIVTVSFSRGVANIRRIQPSLSRRSGVIVSTRVWETLG